MRTTDKLEALVDGGTQHVRSALDNIRDLSRRRPWLVIGLGAALVLAAVLAFGIHRGWHEEAVELVQDTVLAKPTLTELKRRAKLEPRNAPLHRDLGHAYFAAGSRVSALRAYASALANDPKIADSKLVDNLLSCWGRREQSQAAALLTKYRLTQAAPRLSQIVRARGSGRAEAFRTLANLGRATRGDYVAYYLVDLEASDCDMRRRAVDRLGTYADKGDKRVIAALRAAAKKDADETPWYRRKCLGDGPHEAEAKILARK
jgi:tetratricopeptide (TPR) repeat protein